MIKGIITILLGLIGLLIVANAINSVRYEKTAEKMCQRYNELYEMSMQLLTDTNTFVDISKEYVQNISNLSDTVAQNSDTICNKTYELIENHKKLANEYVKLKSENESLEIALSTVVPLLNDEDIQEAQAMISKKVTEINAERGNLN